VNWLTFGLSSDDFRDCVPGPVPLGRLRRRLKQLEVELVKFLPSNFLPLTKRDHCHYVSRIRKRGGGPYRDVMWIGMAHENFSDPREGVQLQFGLTRYRVTFEGIWIEASALASRRDAQHSLISHKEWFLAQLKGLPEQYYLSLQDETQEIFHKVAVNANESQVDQFLSTMGNRNVYVYLGKDISARKAISLKGRIVRDIVQTFSKLLKIYMMMIKEPMRGVSKKIQTTTEFAVGRGVPTDDELMDRTLGIVRGIGSKSGRVPKRVLGAKGTYAIKRKVLPLNLHQRKEIDGCVVYLDDEYNDDDLKRRRKLLAEFRRLVSGILHSLEMNTECAQFLLKSPSTDARYILSGRDTRSGRILLNLVRFEKNKSVYFWLFAVAREIAYMVHRRLGYKHVNLMRDVMTVALSRMIA